VADQLGHSDPVLTLRVYAHAMLYTAPTPECDPDETPKVAERLARREGLEPPTLRFEERKKQKK
jgi:hypothetical protein